MCNIVSKKGITMTAIYNWDIQQGTPEWNALRCGLITASGAKHLMSPTGKVADNDKTRQYIYELAAQRITGFAENSYQSEDMLRGHAEELLAREVYESNYGMMRQCGFITRQIGNGLDSRPRNPIVGYSPDGVIGKDGLWECKSRQNKYQIQVVAANTVPQEHMLQLQFGLWVTEREWIDSTSYSNGMCAFTLRVGRDEAVIANIEAAVLAAEQKIVEVVSAYYAVRYKEGVRIVDVERIREEIEA